MKYTLNVDGKEKTKRILIGLNWEAIAETQKPTTKNVFITELDGAKRRMIYKREGTIFTDALGCGALLEAAGVDA